MASIWESIGSLFSRRSRSGERALQMPSWMASFTSYPFSSGGNTRGGYTAGKATRLTEDWRPGEVGPNRAHQMDGQLLRERAWDLYHNNPYAGSAVDAYISNVIECGIVPEFDGDSREAEWRRWCGVSAHATRDCDLSRDQTFYELQQLVLTEVIVGGGCLVHFVDVPRRSQRVPLAIELIGENRFATELQMSGPNKKTANPVRNGIEIDSATGRSVAYHVRKAQPNDLEFDPLETIRLPCEQCEYVYVKGRIGAKRGTSLLKNSIMWLWALGYYTDNELAASDLKSSWAYIIRTTSGVDGYGGLAGESESQLTDVNGNPIDRHEPGMIWRGDEADDIVGVGPNVPGGDSLPWITMIQRSIAIGVRLSYEDVFRDYSKVSFSAVRIARGQDKKRYRPLQFFMIHHFCNPTIKRFSRAAVGAMLPGFPRPSEFAGGIEDEWLDAQHWQTPGWESPNPKDDALAHHQMLEDRTISRTEIAASQGRNWRRSAELLGRENEVMSDAGVAPSSPVEPQQSPVDEPSDEDKENAE